MLYVDFEACFHSISTDCFVSLIQSFFRTMHESRLFDFGTSTALSQCNIHESFVFKLESSVSSQSGYASLRSPYAALVVYVHEVTVFIL